MQKTVREWFQTIEDPEVRKKALANSDNDASEVCLSQALLGGFAWSNTEEGYGFWRDQFNLARRNEGMHPISDIEFETGK